MRLTTRQATLEEIHSLYLCIPEFGSLHSLSDLQQRIGDNPSHGLIAEIDGQAAGFKLGYQTTPGEFYSWLGAVLPAFRRKGSPKPCWRSRSVGRVRKAINSCG
ncbi:Uncharacterised protein [Serratia fonticola]|uniref:Acetyltransferase n=1 Tax=Serratia fonticola TaxID=47917 RepID=A0A4U9U0W2_SERFO|nr:Uncharacterised protein [Serratia fonticola]